MVILLDEVLCAAWRAERSLHTLERPTSIRYLSEALNDFKIAGFHAEPGRLRIRGQGPSGVTELSLIGAPRSFALAFAGDAPAAGFRRPLDRPWESYLPLFDAGATEDPPPLPVLERWRAEIPPALSLTALARLSLSLSPALAREAMFRSEGGGLGALERALGEVIFESRESLLVRVYRDGDVHGALSAAALTHRGAGSSSHPSVMEAAAILDQGALEPARLEASRRTAAQPLRKRISRQERALGKLSAERDEMESAGEMESRGHALFAYGGGLARGLKEARLPDTADPDRILEIPLDPTRTGIENGAVLLKKAAKMKRRAEALERRVGEVTGQAEAARKEMESILSSAAWPELEERGVLEEERRAAPTESDREEAARGEVYRVTSEEGWAVLIGRNAAQNEHLTHRLARADDLWFHAEHVPGSHVVLRVESQPGDPSRKTLEEVAGYAAFFSKAKTSSRAPVIMAEKRHVRKARGGPGKVMVERGKTLVVRPRKPETPA